ncbi:MAG TPA: hypothetical protein VI756_02000 [Blastocatellia bacterium]
MKKAGAVRINVVMIVTAMILGIGLLMQIGCDNPQPEPIPGPAPAPAESTMYSNFRNVAAASGIDLSRHPSYTEEYVVSRAHYFCGLMSAGDITKLTSEITFPPVQSMFETTQDRSRLEAIILKTGTPMYCPASNTTANQWLATYVR